MRSRCSVHARTFNLSVLLSALAMAPALRGRGRRMLTWRVRWEHPGNGTHITMGAGRGSNLSQANGERKGFEGAARGYLPTCPWAHHGARELRTRPVWLP
jgi:hypothetical protein